jgi:hypothetical protein
VFVYRGGIEKMARPKRAVTTAKAAVAKTAEPKTTEVKATEVKAEEKKVVEEKAAAKTTAKKTTRKPACKVSTCVELNGLSVSVADVEAAVKKAVKASGAEATDIKIYINAAEQAAYYTVDGAGDATNKVDLKTL